ncbi:hypothetical protein M422DRAFT_262449 [Sphaerobolus stellatus SS14]|uniref:DUF4048 domain-containing protein n=1 Tax=Sphaerobolus stellatus (strain SS14) TaxID=990650 RepID=A0A0C9TXU2_SPHS4|nr:hypothetical protein M422DRAFT_262449 [Sphaerobolus stellatus SS14]
MATTTSTRQPPRPLRLASGSTGGSLSSPLSSSTASPISATITRESFTNDTPSPRTRYGPRRQSSISYNTGLTSPRTPVLSRSNSMSAKPPTETTHSEHSEEEGSILHRSSLPAVREGEPIMLAEKHADLLRFIAQKEAKCLDLRTQLAQHESDLIQLKRKWERIVSKGVPQSGRTDAAIAGLAATDVLEGIRGGVQSGFEKMLAVLEPPSRQPSPQPSPTTSSPSLSTPAKPEVLPIAPKRFSTSTVSSVSGHGRSSLNGSRSSAGSLFDDISSVGEHSIDTSVDEDGEDTSASSNTEKAEEPPTQNSPLSSLEPHEHSRSFKTHKSRPMSMSLSQFSSLASPANLAPLTKQVANWVPPSFNKKWEELKGNETISKQSKRASVLFNDMFAALAPSPTASESSCSQANGPQWPSNNKTGTNALLGLDTGSLGSMDVGAGISPQTAASWSLMDDDTITSSSPILQPDVLKPTTKAQEEQTKTVEELDDIDEDWNW